MNTSDILLLDIKEVLAKIAIVKADEDSNLWLNRSLKLLMSLLPIVIFLEQSGKTINASSLVSLDTLEAWVLDVEKNISPQKSSLLLFDLKKFLEILPGYKKNTIGNQDPWVHESYGYIIMMAIGLRNAANAADVLQLVD